MTTGEKLRQSIGSKAGLVIGVVAGVLIWYLLIRTPGGGGGYMPAGDRAIVLILTVLLGAVGAWVGDVIQKRLGTHPKAAADAGKGEM